VLAIPVWIVWQHARARQGFDVALRFDPRDAVPCTIEPVALRARLLAGIDEPPRETR
jgi:hypothetical protein